MLNLAPGRLGQNSCAEIEMPISNPEPEVADERCLPAPPSVAIGGGLAGAAFALELARNGRPVLLIEKSRSIQHKVCGEFLSAEAQGLLAYLGLDVWALGATQIARLAIARGNDSRVAQLPFRGAGLSRVRLDEALLASAQEAGAQVLRGVSVTGIECSPERVFLRATGGRSFHATHVALATGKHIIKGIARATASTVAFKIQLSITATAKAALRDLVQLTVFPGGYVGACLVEDNIATICWVTDQTLLRDTGTDWSSQSTYLSRQSKLMCNLLRGAQPLWRKPVAVAAIPYGFLRRDVISGRVYPLGDQLAVIPSYTGDGMSIALYSGIAAARAILDKRPANEFQRAIVSQLRPQLAWARAANFPFEYALAQRAGIAMARTMPWAFQKLVTLVSGMTRLRDVRGS